MKLTVLLNNNKTAKVKLRIIVMNNTYLKAKKVFTESVLQWESKESFFVSQPLQKSFFSQTKSQSLVEKSIL